MSSRSNARARAVASGRPDAVSLRVGAACAAAHDAGEPHLALALALCHELAKRGLDEAAAAALVELVAADEDRGRQGRGEGVPGG